MSDARFKRQLDQLDRCIQQVIEILPADASEVSRTLTSVARAFSQETLVLAVYQLLLEQVET